MEIQTLAVFFMGVLFVGAFLIKDYGLAAISGILSMILGIYVLTNHFIGINDNLVLALGIIFIGVGFYILVRASIELLEGGK